MPLDDVWWTDTVGVGAVLWLLFAEMLVVADCVAGACLQLHRRCYDGSGQG